MSKSLDERMKETVKEDFENTPSSPLSKEEAWEKLQEQLTGEPVESKKSPVRRYAKLITVAASLVVILFGLFLFQSQNGSAFGWITKYFLETDGDTTQLKQSITEPGSGDKPPVPPAQKVDTTISKETMDLSEAKSVVQFPITVPNKLPGDFQLKNVTVWFRGDNTESNKVVLHYVNGKKSFIIEETYIQNEMGSALFVDNEDTEIKKVTIDGQRGTLFLFKDGSKQLIWTKLKTRFVLEGNLSKEALLSIAKSM